MREEKMFCSNCGNVIKEGDAFCEKCGTQIGTAEPEMPVEASNEPQASEIISADNVVQNEEVAAPDDNSGDCVDAFAQPAFEEKPKKHFSFKKLIIPAVALILVVAIVLNLGAVMGTVLRFVGSDKAYFKYVQNKVFADATSPVTDVYGLLLGEDADEVQDIAALNTLSVDVDDNFATLLKDEFGLDLGEAVDYINDIELLMDTKASDNKLSLATAIKMSDVKIITLDIIQDYAKDIIYLGLPELSDTYLSADMNLDTEAVENIIKVLPPKDEIKKLLYKYVEIALDNIENVSKETEALTVRGVSQKCTVLRFEITPEVLNNIAEDVLKEAKKDDEIKQIIKDVQKALEKSDMNYSDDDLYDEFRDVIDDALDAIEQEETDSDEKIIIREYVNSSHEIIGIKVKANDEELLFAGKAQKGSDIAYKLEVEDAFIITGKGTEKSGMLNSDFALEVDGEELCELKISKLDTKKLQDGYLNGTFRIKGTDRLYEEVIGDSSASSFISLVDPTIEIVIEDSEKAGKFSINLLKGNNEKLISINLEGELTDDKKISVPSGKNTMNVGEDFTQDELIEWIDTLNTDKVISALKKTDLPDEIVNVLEQTISSLPAMIKQNILNSAKDYEDYDDYYEDVDSDFSYALEDGGYYF